MKVVFYTCNTGPEDGFVPSIKEELPDSIRAYYLHDGNIPTDPDKGWEYIDIRDQYCPENVQLRQRYGKILAHKWFPDADWTIYLDQKWYLPRSFFETCINVIKNAESREFFVPSHPDNRTLVDELMFAYNRGTFSEDYTIDVAKSLISLGANPDHFTSMLACFLIRKNTEEVIKASISWYNLLSQVYNGPVRDQVFLPYCGAKISLIDDFHNLMEAHETFQVLKPTSRVSEWRESEELRSTLFRLFLLGR